MDNPITPATPAAPPGTALQIAQMLAAGKIDTTQAGKLSKAGNISTLQVAQALNVLHVASERQEPDVRSPEVKQLDAQLPAAKPEDYLIPYFRPGENATMTPQLKEFDASARAGSPRRGLSAISAIPWSARLRASRSRRRS